MWGAIIILTQIFEEFSIVCLHDSQMAIRAIKCKPFLFFWVTNEPTTCSSWIKLLLHWIVESRLGFTSLNMEMVETRFSSSPCFKWHQVNWLARHSVQDICCGFQCLSPEKNRKMWVCKHRPYHILESFLSTTPFCWGVPGVVYCATMPFCSR